LDKSPKSDADRLRGLRVAFAAVPGADEATAALDRFPRSFLEALTHASLATQKGIPSNQRLEMLGDGVVNLVAATLVFTEFHAADEGVLTRARWALVRTESLAEIGRALGLADVLAIGLGAPPTLSSQEAVLADAFEAVVGATYLSGGLPAAESLVRPLLQRMLARAPEGAVSAEDPKTALQMRAQKELQSNPTYVVVSETGPDHARTFVVDAMVAGQAAGRGEGPSKKHAAQAAAQAALSAFESIVRAVRAAAPAIAAGEAAPIESAPPGTAGTADGRVEAAGRQNGPDARSEARARGRADARARRAAGSGGRAATPRPEEGGRGVDGRNPRG